MRRRCRKPQGFSCCFSCKHEQLFHSSFAVKNSRGRLRLLLWLWRWRQRRRSQLSRSGGRSRGGSWSWSRGRGPACPACGAGQRGAAAAAGACGRQQDGGGLEPGSSSGAGARSAGAAPLGGTDRGCPLRYGGAPAVRAALLRGAGPQLPRAQGPRLCLLVPLPRTCCSQTRGLSVSSACCCGRAAVAKESGRCGCDAPDEGGEAGGRWLALELGARRRTSPCRRGGAAGDGGGRCDGLSAPALT